MMNFNIKKLAATVCILALSLTGCNKVHTDTVEGNVTGQGVSIDRKVDTKDEITVAMNMTNTFNPLINSDESADGVFSLLYEKLVEIDKTGKAVPNIASGWEFNEDGSNVVIRLRNDVCFSDGTRLNAYDVAYSLKTIDNAENSYYKNCLENIKTWAVLDDYSISITFYEGTGRNIYYLAIPIISSVFYGGDYAVLKDKPDTALGTGFYRFESFKKPDKLTLIASLNCFKGMADVTQADVLMTKDEETKVNLFSQGITDILAADKTDAAGATGSSGVKSTLYLTDIYDFIGFNFENPILRDRNVRQAIAYAVDKNAMIEGIYLNNAEKAYSPVSSSSWMYESSVYGYEYDPAVAKMLLEQSGWLFRTGEESVRKSADDKKLSLRLLVNGENDERKQVAVKLAGALKGIGFEINVETVNFQTYMQKLQSGNYDIFIGSWHLAPTMDFTFMFGSEELNDEGNIINYSSAKMDEYLTACKNAVSDEDMLKAYSSLQKYISQELPYISIVFRESKIYTGSRIEGEMTPVVYEVFDGIENIKIKR